MNRDILIYRQSRDKVFITFVEDSKMKSITLTMSDSDLINFRDKLTESINQKDNL